MCLWVESERGKDFRTCRQVVNAGDSTKSHVGYDMAAKIAKHAHTNATTLREAAVAMGIDGDDFDEWVKPEEMTSPSE